MRQIEKSLMNSCGHISHYRIISVRHGVDLESDINGLCSVCKKEDAEFKAQIAHVFSKLFSGIS
jgi:hypothetical protein